MTSKKDKNFGVLYMCRLVLGFMQPFIEKVCSPLLYSNFCLFATAAISDSTKSVIPIGREHHYLTCPRDSDIFPSRISIRMLIQNEQLFVERTISDVLAPAPDSIWRTKLV